MAVIPLVVRSRSVALVLGDCGDGGVDNEALEQIGACGTTIGRAFERLIIRKKKTGLLRVSLKRLLLATPPPR